MPAQSSPWSAMDCMQPAQVGDVLRRWCRAASRAMSSSSASRTAMASLTVDWPSVTVSSVRRSRTTGLMRGDEQSAAAAGTDLDRAALGEQPGGLADRGAPVAGLLPELVHGRDAVPGLEPALDDRLLDLGRELLGESRRFGKHTGSLAASLDSPGDVPKI